MLTLLLIMALMVIFAAAIIPEITFEIKRDREEEMIHRGVQYSRAIRAYYKKFGRYPVKMEDLENTNQLRFLRKRYKDPADQQGLSDCCISARRSYSLNGMRHDCRAGIRWEAVGHLTGCARFRTAAFDVREEQRIRRRVLNAGSRTKSGRRLIPWRHPPDPTQTAR